MKIRAKPIVTDAWKLNLADDRNIMMIYEKIHNVELSTMYGVALPIIKVEIAKNGGLVIPTLEGKMLASDGDWVIKGVFGGFYVCKPDVFETLYEVAE